MRTLIISLVVAYSICTSVVIPTPAPKVVDFKILRDKMLKCLTETKEASQILRDYAQKLLNDDKEPMRFAQLALEPTDRIYIKACWKQIDDKPTRSLREVEEVKEEKEMNVEEMLAATLGIKLEAFRPEGIVECLEVGQPLFAEIRKVIVTWKSQDWTTAIKYALYDVDLLTDTFNKCKAAIFPE